MSAKQPPNHPTSSPQNDSGSLIRELWEHFYPKEFVATLFAYFKDHRKFFDEVFRGEWENKLKPVPFYFASFSIVLVVSLIFPFVNPFYMVDETTDLGGVNKFLTHELVTTALLAIFLMCYWFAAKVFHRCLNVPNRTQKETIYVYLYNSSAFILLNIPSAFFKNEGFVTSLAGNNPELILIFTGLVFAVAIFSIIKTVMVFRYTHNVGFGRLLWASIKTFLMIFLLIITLGIPLLFMSFEKTEQQKASGRRLQRALLGIAVVVGVFVLLYWANTVEDSSDSGESPSLAKAGIQLEEKIASGSELVKPREKAESSPMLAEKLLGIWYSEIEETISESEGSLTVRSTTEYFRNSTSTSVGELVLRTYTPEGQEFEIMYNCVATGEWMLHGRKLTEKLIDMKIKPKYFIVNDERTDVDDLDRERQEQFSKIEDEIPKGISEESEIIEIGANIMRVKGRDSAGEEKITVYYKRDRPFVLK
jgi:hypothetical protein